MHYDSRFRITDLIFFPAKYQIKNLLVTSLFVIDKVPEETEYVVRDPVDFLTYADEDDGKEKDSEDNISSTGETFPDGHFTKLPIFVVGVVVEVAPRKFCPTGVSKSTEEKDGQSVDVEQDTNTESRISRKFSLLLFLRSDGCLMPKR